MPAVQHENIFGTWDGRQPTIPEILRSVRSIAVVGASANWNRPSYFVMRYLQAKGYRILPINPGQAGKEILGETCHARLAEVPAPVHMVEVFRNSEAAGEVVDEAIGLKEEKAIRVVWLQLGVVNTAACERAAAAGLVAVQDRCPKIEFGRHHSELAWAGVDTGIVSAKRQRIRLE